VLRASEPANECVRSLTGMRRVVLETRCAFGGQITETIAAAAQHEGLG
jgi:hypothetical protein